jgi:hypothetical protein
MEAFARAILIGALLAVLVPTLGVDVWDRGAPAWHLAGAGLAGMVAASVAPTPRRRRAAMALGAVLGALSVAVAYGLLAGAARALDWLHGAGPGSLSAMHLSADAHRFLIPTVLTALGAGALAGSLWRRALAATSGP